MGRLLQNVRRFRLKSPSLPASELFRDLEVPVQAQRKIMHQYSSDTFELHDLLQTATSWPVEPS